jgi:hypothetical protein
MTTPLIAWKSCSPIYGRLSRDARRTWPDGYVEKDKHGTSGFFLFHHKQLEEPCLYDNWLENVDYAFEAAEMNYAIKKEDWITLEA